jgi:hypothetical protein
MTNIAISALPSATAAAITDLLPIVQSGVTKKITNQLLFTNSQLTTPVLGTPTSGTLTNCTGLPIIAGTTGTLSVARGGTGVTASTGTGSVVLSNTPTLTSPILGTPTSGTLSNCTGLPVATGISGLGVNVATFLTTPSSANLRAALSDETGTGSAVFATAPTFTGMPLIPTATVAATGSADTDAAPVTTGFTLVTAADGTKGVILPTAVAGAICIIKNIDAANAVLKVYPATSDGINALTVTTGSYNMAAKTSVMLVAYDATTWYTIPLLAS